MEHLKTFEQTHYNDIKTDINTDICIYLEENQPISKEDGFIECLYNTDPIDFTFYYHENNMTEETTEQVYDFLEENGLEIDSDSISHNIWEITVIPTKEKLKELSELVSNTKKYNI